MNPLDVSANPVCSPADTLDVLNHIGAFCARTLQLEIATRASDKSFIGKPADPVRPGILEITGELHDTGHLHLTLLLVRWPSHLAVPVADIWNRLAGLNNRVRLIPGVSEGDNHVLLRAVLPVQAAIMGFSRAAAFQEDFRRKAFCGSCPCPEDQHFLEWPEPHPPMINGRSVRFFR